MSEKLIDTLTGFPMDVVLRQKLEEHPKDFLVPTIVIVFDGALYWGKILRFRFESFQNQNHHY